MEDDTSPLLVIGAGPKAAALAAKSKVLRDLGHKAPRICILERTDVCANWSGKYGFTDGKQFLGTPPEKDVGFPYMEDRDAPDVTKALFSEFSWPSYLNFSRYGYGEWIDRGRPPPTHEEWARYIRHVINGSDAELIIGECENLEIEDREWRVIIDEGGTQRAERYSGIVVTGPGTAKAPFDMPESRMIKHGDTFWSAKRELLTKLDSGPGAHPIVVVGGGETAAAIVSHIVEVRGDTPPGIIVLTRHGAIFSRGEGYYENSRFTDSSDWQSLNERVRREVIDRTDRGVFSTDSIRKLSNARSVRHQCFEVTDVRKKGTQSIELLGNGPSDRALPCQLLIWALGFDSFWFIDLLPSSLKQALNALGEAHTLAPDPPPENLDMVRELPGDIRNEVIPSVEPPLAKKEREYRRNRAIERLIQHDLSLPSELAPAKLYLPMISAFSQGPGFPNLSCLGDLSDRILQRKPIVR